MKKIVLFLIFSLILSQICLPATPVLAQDSNSVMVDYLVEKGKLYYERGNYISAIHEFSKAVAVDPNNREAQQYLKDLGASGGYYGRSRRQVHEVLRASEEISKYKRQLRILAKKNSRNKKLAQKLRENNTKLLQLVEDREKDNRTLMVRIKEALVFEKLANVNAKEVKRLTLEKADLYQQYALVQKEVAAKDRENRGLRKSVELARRDVKRQAQRIDKLAAENDSWSQKYSHSRQEIALQREEKEGLLKTVERVESDARKTDRELVKLAEQRDALSEKYAQAQKDVSLGALEKKDLMKKMARVEKAARQHAQEKEVLSKEKQRLTLAVEQVRQDAQQKTAENKDLHRRIIIVQNEADTLVRDHQTKLERMQKTLDSKRDEVARLNDVLFGIKGQLAAKIALLKEKEGMIHFMGRDKDTLQQELLAKTEKYKQEITKIETLFDRYKKHKSRSDEEFNAQIKKLHNVIRKNRLELAFLNDRLLFTEYKLSGREAQVSGRNQMISQLKESLFSIEKELASFQSKNLEKGKDLDETIAKQIVADAQREKLVKAKDKLITSLKMRLVQARKKIKLMSRNEGEVAAVKRDLDQIKAQLRSQTALGKNELSPDELEDQIRDLQNKLEAVEGIMRGDRPARPGTLQSG